MNNSLDASSRTLFRWAMGIFLVTIVIGILNGLDVWDPGREMLLTHVHAGTLGWITLSVIGVALRIFGRADDEAAAASGKTMSQAAAGAAVLYVITFASTTGIMRPIAGTLMLIAIVWALVWVKGQYGASEKTVPGLAMYLAMISLTVGAVLGVLLGLFIANGSIPGLSTEMAGSLAGAHPPAMLVGYLMLAGAAIAEYFLSDRQTKIGETKTGRTQVWVLFLAGMLFNIAFIADVDALIQVATLFELVGVVIFVVRMRAHLSPGAFSVPGNAYGSLSVAWLAIGMGLFVYLVQLFISGAIDPEAGEGLHIIVSFDHAMFLGVMTNALLLALASMGSKVGKAAIMWAVNIGLVGFIAGLMTESATLKQIFSPIMGAALLWAAYVVLLGKDRSSA